MKNVAITGLMGSGKSFICSIFEEKFRIPVFDSDTEAKKCYSFPEVKNKVCEKIDKNLIEKNGNINLKKLGDLVFTNKNKLFILNKIIHPVVMELYKEWTEKQTSPYTLFESAIIYECNLDKFFDKIIYVKCPENISIQRVKIRNGWSEKNIIKRLEQQQNQLLFAEKSDFIIEHDSTETLNKSRKNIIPRIEFIHEKILHN